MTIRTNQIGVRKASEVYHPQLNTSYKLKDAKRHYLDSAKAHRKQELQAFEAVLKKIVTGSRSKDTRQANVDEARRAVKSVLRAMNIKYTV
jgi:hypothetical protein